MYCTGVNPSYIWQWDTLTIGNDPSTSATLESMGTHHVTCDARNIVKDTKHKIVTTPAYMLAENIHEVFGSR